MVSSKSSYHKIQRYEINFWRWLVLRRQSSPEPTVYAVQSRGDYPVTDGRGGHWTQYADSGVLGPGPIGALRAARGRHDREETSPRVSPAVGDRRGSNRTRNKISITARYYSWMRRLHWRHTLHSVGTITPLSPRPLLKLYPSSCIRRSEIIRKPPKSRRISWPLQLARDDRK